MTLRSNRDESQLKYDSSTDTNERKSYSDKLKSIKHDLINYERKLNTYMTNCLKSFSVNEIEELFNKAELVYKLFIYL